MLTNETEQQHNFQHVDVQLF